MLSQQKFDVNEVWSAYSKWYKNGGFDTGSAFVITYKALQQNKDLTPTKLSKLLYESAIAKNERPSIGIGSAHRAAVLSMFPSFISPFDQNEDTKENEKMQKLENVAIDESCLTHYAPLCRDCSVAVNYLCRALIIGYEWTDALKVCYEHIQSEQIKQILLVFIERNNLKMKLKQSGYAPDVFAAALYFLSECKSFDAAMSSSIHFAGNENFCPVLVGSIGGARYGIDVVRRSKHFKHKLNARLIEKDALSVCMDVANCKGMKVSDFEINLAEQIGALWK